MRGGGGGGGGEFEKQNYRITWHIKIKSQGSWFMHTQFSEPVRVRSEGLEGVGSLLQQLGETLQHRPTWRGQKLPAHASVAA